MSWETEMVGTLRVMIDDLEAPYKNSDDKLKKVIALGGRLVIIDTGPAFSSYFIDVVTPDFTPDPTDAPRDSVFIDLVLLRSACIIDQGNLRESSSKPSTIIKEFQSSIAVDYKGVLEARLKIIEIGYCQTYDDALSGYLYGDSGNYCVAVVSPFRYYYSSYSNTNNFLLGK